MKFKDVDVALKYAHGVECWSWYKEGLLAQWMSENSRSWRPSSGMTKLDHLAYAGKITQLVRGALSQHLCAVVDARYLMAAPSGTQLADRHRTNRKIEQCVRVSEWCPHVVDDERYAIDQIRRWGDMDPINSQADWAVVLDSTERTLSRKNKPLIDWLNDELGKAWFELEVVFIDKGVVG